MLCSKQHLTHAPVLRAVRLTAGTANSSHQWPKEQLVTLSQLENAPLLGDIKAT